MPGIVIRILVGLATILATLAVLAWLERESYSQVNICVVDDTEKEVIRSIVLKGIDHGLEDHIVLVFGIWMKDAAEQPKRAIVGTNAGINAYVRARANILKWEPSICASDGPKLQSGSSRPYVLPPRER